MTSAPLSPAAATSPDEEARAEELARAKLRRLRGLDDETAHRRLVSYLLRRGYKGQVAQVAAVRVLSGPLASPVD